MIFKIVCFCFLFFCYCVSSLPTGSVTPFCNAPQASDNNVKWCYNTYLVSPFNATAGTTLIQASGSYCVAQSNIYSSNSMQTLYSGYSSIVPSYNTNNMVGNGYYYKVSSVCLMQNTFTVFNVSCHYLYSSTSPYDAVMPSSSNVLSNAMPGAYFTVNGTRVYSAYCLAENDSSIASSLVMPNSCIVFFNSNGVATVCQPLLMENMPTCNDATGTRSSTNYNGGSGTYFADRGLAVCARNLQTDAAPLNGASPCSTPVVTTANYVSQTCGSSSSTLSTGTYATSYPFVKTVSVYNPGAAVTSSATTVDYFFLTELY